MGWHEETPIASRLREPIQGGSDAPHGGQTPARGLPKLVSVIIPALNAERTIAEQLEALAQQSYDGEWEVVIADNGSTDGTRQVVARFRDRLPSLIVIDASSTRGAAHARNAAVQRARGDFLAMCDADDVVASHWLEQLVTTATGADMVAGPLIPLVSPSGSGSPDRPRPPFSLPRPFGYLPTAPTGNCGIWRDAFDSLSGFSEDLTSGEDWDLSWRVQRAGYTLAPSPLAVVLRRPRGRTRETATQFYRYGKGAYQLLTRHPVPAGARKRRRLLWILLRLPYVFLSPRRRRVWIRSAAYWSGYTSERIRGWSAPISTAPRPRTR